MCPKVARYSNQKSDALPVISFYLQSIHNLLKLTRTFSALLNAKIGLDSFKIIRKYRSDYDAKIHKTLLVKKHSPSLNRQPNASGQWSIFFGVYKFF